MKKILITQSQLKNLAGSEVVTLELASEFSRRGWLVTILTHYFDSPIADYFNDIENLTIIKTSSVTHENLDLRDFDLVWIHHYTMTEGMLDQLCEATIRPKVIFNHMSHYEPLEDVIFPDFERSIGDAVLFNSPETMDVLKKKHAINDDKKLFVFANPAPNAFNAKPKAKKRKMGARKVAIVSNHPPDELLAAKKLIEGDGGVVDIYGSGKGATVKRITPDVLADYDTVVSIGKTVQYCIAMQKPIYCYDSFGGPGYLNEANFNKASYNNFSGRGFKKKTAAAIAKGIIQGVGAARADMEKLKLHYSSKYLLEEALDEVIESNPTEEKRHFEYDSESVRSFVRLLNRYVANHVGFGALQASIKPLEGEVSVLRADLEDEKKAAARYRSMYGRVVNSRRWRYASILNTALGVAKRRIHKIFDRYELARSARALEVSGGMGAYIATGYTGNADYGLSSNKLLDLNHSLINWQTLAAGKYERDLISVIVLAYSDAEMTSRCVESLYQSKNKQKFEVILVNNGSDRKTTNGLIAIKKNYEDVKLVTIDTNTNFALGNSLGFQYASGETVVFLNNDTEVTDGWLDGLYRGFKQKGVILAQPTLLFPDKTVQNIGITFSDMSPFGYPMYVNFSSTNKRVMKTRMVRAVTGACLMIRAKDYIKLRGFDPVYINGQEDVDLSMRLGGTVADIGICVSDSIVYHYEGKTPGRGRYVRENRATFANRWMGKIKSDDIGKYTRDGYEVIAWRGDGLEENQIYVPTLKRKGVSL